MPYIQGQKVNNVEELIGVFDAQEGQIESYSGGIGQGKTYGATRRVIRDLQKGRVVYTNWRIDLSQYSGDQRESILHVIFNLIFFRKRFYNIDLHKNWHYFDLDASNAVEVISRLTDCVVYCDEGQDLFDSYEGTKMSKDKRKSLTRTRHLNKTLVIISQRPQAIAVTARANVNIFYKHVCALRWPFVLFKVYATEDIDANNMPLFDDAKVVERYFGSQRIFNTYNSKYLRGGIPTSQEVYFEAFDFSAKQRLLLLYRHLKAFGGSLIPRRGVKASEGEKTLSTRLDILHT